MITITISGAGPAGSSAAIAAASEGARVLLQDRSRFPRHRVCGEFLSPEILPALDHLGVLLDFQASHPAPIRRMMLFLGARPKSGALPELAYGLSRYRFDDLLYRRALQLGVHGVRELQADPAPPLVIARGRGAGKDTAEKGRRLFGFKAHYRGSSTDMIELHFFRGGYVGINAVENEATNVCGLASEHVLQRFGFEYDGLIASVPSLRDRLSRLERSMDWMTTGPLVYGNRFDEPPADGVYLAGDALSFVDPFTGSGLCSAVLTGTIAGQSAARGVTSEEHLRRCRHALGRPFAFASLFRSAIAAGVSEYLAPFIPAAWLFRLTRPRVR